MGLNKRLLIPQAATTPFTSAAFDSVSDFGVSTTSYWALSDSHLSSDGFVYTTSRTGVGYWRLDKTSLSTGTVTNITSGTSPAYAFYGIIERNGDLYINEYRNNSTERDIAIWTKAGARSSTFISNYSKTNNALLNMAYSSVADEILILDQTYDDQTGGDLIIRVYNGSTGSFKRNITLSNDPGFASAIVWCNIGGDGVFFVMDYFDYRAHQYTYDGTYTNFYIDYSTYGTTRGRGAFFNPETNKIYIGCNDSQVSNIRNRHAIYTLS